MINIGLSHFFFKSGAVQYNTIADYLPYGENTYLCIQLFSSVIN